MGKSSASEKNNKIIDTLIEKLKNYKKEQGFKVNSEDCLIKDVVYFVGVSISGEYEYFNGFKKFLNKITNTTSPPK